MFDAIINFIQQHAHHAHWFIFAGAILAALHIPISIDVLMILSAVIASTLMPEHTIHLFLAITSGCLIAGWISYWVGRTLGLRLARTSFFSKIISPERIEKMKDFYTKYGFFAFIIGRFIPFGVRNALFMSSGMAKMPFGKFIARDAVACTLWSSLCFFLFYTLGKNIDVLYHYVKIFNVAIFALLSMTVIGIVWYKKRQKEKQENV